MYAIYLSIASFKSSYWHIFFFLFSFFFSALDLGFIYFKWLTSTYLFMNFDRLPESQTFSLHPFFPLLHYQKMKAYDTLSWITPVIYGKCPFFEINVNFRKFYVVRAEVVYVKGKSANLGTKPVSSYTFSWNLCYSKNSAAIFISLLITFYTFTLSERVMPG